MLDVHGNTREVSQKRLFLTSCLASAGGVGAVEDAVQQLSRDPLESTFYGTWITVAQSLPSRRGKAPNIPRHGDGLSRL